jgi:hypothetical protein
VLTSFRSAAATVTTANLRLLLPQLSALGDAESVYVQPANSLAGSGPRGISAVAAQRVVRQAAVALKDLHTMAGSMHLDLKVNNLLVSPFLLLFLLFCFCLALSCFLFTSAAVAPRGCVH